jgi:ferredoxin
LNPDLYNDIIYIDIGNKEKINKIKDVLRYLENIFEIKILNKFDVMLIKKESLINYDYYTNLFESVLDNNKYKNIREIGIICNRCMEDCPNYYQEYLNVLGGDLSKFYNKKIIIGNYLQNTSKIDLIKSAINKSGFTIEDISNLTFPCDSISDGMECLDCQQCMDKCAILHAFGKTRPFYNKKIIMDYSKNQIKMKLDHIVDYLKRLSLKYITRSF